MALTHKSFANTRIGAGTLSQSTLLGSSTYLVTEWAATNDMSNTPIEWKAVGLNINDGVTQRSISGTGATHGFYSGMIVFQTLTPQMRFYILNTILQGKTVNDVTISVYHPNFEQSEFTCKMEFPARMSEAGEQISAGVYANVQFPFFRGTILGNAWDDGFDDGFG